MVTAPERLLDSRTQQAGTLVPALSSPRTIPAGQRSWLHSSHWVSVGAGCWQQEPAWGGSACGWEPEAWHAPPRQELCPQETKWAEEAARRAGAQELAQPGEQ